MDWPEPFYPWQEHMAIDLPAARAVFTTRRGGFSKGPYESLNLGKLTRDDSDAVGRNRLRLQSQLEGRMAMIRQVHGTRVVRRTGPHEASGVAPNGDLDEADGQATSSPRGSPRSSSQPIACRSWLPAVGPWPRCMRGGADSPTGSSGRVSEPSVNWPRNGAGSQRRSDPAPADAATRSAARSTNASLTTTARFTGVTSSI